jgi:hypothetical protein
MRAMPGRLASAEAATIRPPASPANFWFSETHLFQAAAAIVVVRALVYLLFEQVGFDSDQAIVGLMAKHAMEGRAFPLFYYGLTYMLGVESWTAVPFFVVLGPTIFALRLSILAWNLAFAWLLLAGLRRASSLAGWYAVVPALFFLAAPASVARQLMAAQGGNIEPFVYVGLLWFLRRQPGWFGAVAAVGFRHREFTLYAVPVLLALDIATGELNQARVQEWLLSLVVFCVVWEGIEALKPFADFLGPGTRGQLLGGFAGSQVSNLSDRFDWQLAGLSDRIRRIGTELLWWFTGAGQVDSGLPLGNQTWLAVAGGLGVAAGAGRLLWLVLSGKAGDNAGPSFAAVPAALARGRFAFYLLGVGGVAIAAFVMGKPDLGGYSRYVLLGLLVPVGLTAALLQLDPHSGARRTTAVIVLCWAMLMVANHVIVLSTFLRRPPPDPVGEIADRLVARQIRVAEAGYWDAYAISFVARERARVASRDVVRVQEYQDLFAEQAYGAVRISEISCAGGERVGRWFLCDK